LSRIVGNKTLFDAIVHELTVKAMPKSIQSAKNAMIKKYIDRASEVGLSTKETISGKRFHELLSPPPTSQAKDQASGLEDVKSSKFP